MVAMSAIKSDMGATKRIISTLWKMAGSIKINGAKQTTSRIMDAITALTGFPAAWKKIQFILIKQLTDIKDRKMRKVFSPNSQ